MSNRLKFYINGAWVDPSTSETLDVINPATEQPIGQIFNTITNGVRNMAGYESQIMLDDRWAIVAYVKALQRSQHARDNDVNDASSLPEYPDETVLPAEEAEE